MLRPQRWFRILWNFVRGKETSKMESFLQETLRKLRLRKRPRQSVSAGATKVATKVSTGNSVAKG